MMEAVLSKFQVICLKCGSEDIDVTPIRVINPDGDAIEFFCGKCLNREIVKKP